MNYLFFGISLNSIGRVIHVRTDEDLSLAYPIYRHLQYLKIQYAVCKNHDTSLVRYEVSPLKKFHFHFFRLLNTLLAFTYISASDLFLSVFPSKYLRLFISNDYHI